MRANPLLNNVSAIDVTENVALLKAAVQSGTYNDAVASRGVDGNLTTHSCTLSSTTDPWLSVDLGTAMEVARVEVTNDRNPHYG